MSHGFANNATHVRALLIWGCLGLVLVAAAILRFVSLDVNPGGLFVDEAAEALSAQRVLHQPGYLPVFIADGGGREALFAYLVALGFRLFGETALVLRGVAAAIGVCAVLAIWLLGRRFGQIAALGGAAWTAGSLWLVCISRDGMRNTLVPLFAALALAALVAWQRKPGVASALLGGAMTSAAALYTYQPLKLLPVLVLVWIWWLHRSNGPAYQAIRSTVPAAAIAFLLVAAPMLAAAVVDSGSYFGRALGVSLFTTSAAELPEHWLRTLGMFTITGDPIPRHDVAAAPLLGWPIFAVAAVGFVRLSKERRQPAHALILLGLPFFLLPPLLATEGGAPHFLRALGLAAPLAVTIGLGIDVIVGWVRARWGRLARAAALVGFAIGLAALAAASGAAYLSRPLADRYEAFDYALVAMANIAGGEDVVIVDDYSAGVVQFVGVGDGDSPRFVEPGTPLQDLPPGTTVVAQSQADLAGSLGAAAAEGARPAAFDPQGRPTVWAVTP
jgi:hypothetical protein